jgi:molybdopterin-containing oxidoreductase family membrane subunit
MEPVDTPVLTPGQSYESLDTQISSLVLARGFQKGWLLGFLVPVFFLFIFMVSLYQLLANGVGIWGNNVPVAWAMPIINFVWWIGIGHAGTLISAILLVFHQSWRNSINRFAEAMTLFAVACAGMYPILHLGRPWFFYWLIPYPNTFGLWPQFRSPLAWDVFAISTYATVSLMFWLVGLLPDFAKLRDKAQNQITRIIWGILSLGWTGSARHWARHEKASYLLAGLSMPLVFSVHSIVSLDFAVANLPGWHVTVFPPYFVAGAVFAGFAMVLNLVIPIRKIYHLENIITMHHIDNMAKVMLATGLIVVYGYMMEAFSTWYSAVEFERFMISNRMFGPYGWSFWALIFCNGLVPQLMWFKSLRRNVVVVFIVSLFVGIGMWLERFVIVATSLTRDFLVSSWGYYTPTFWDWSLYIGTIGLFLALIFLFIRFVPIINIFEMQMLQRQEEEEALRKRPVTMSME